MLLLKFFKPLLDSHLLLSWVPKRGPFGLSHHAHLYCTLEFFTQKFSITFVSQTFWNYSPRKKSIFHFYITELGFYGYTLLDRKDCINHFLWSKTTQITDIVGESGRGESSLLKNGYTFSWLLVYQYNMVLYKLFCSMFETLPFSSI